MILLKIRETPINELPFNSRVNPEVYQPLRKVLLLSLWPQVTQQEKEDNEVTTSSHITQSNHTRKFPFYGIDYIRVTN